MITFDEFFKDIQLMSITILKDNKEYMGFFSNARIDKSTVPDGWHAYDILEGDGRDFYCLQNNVGVNHGGTFVTSHNLNIKDDERLIFLDFEETNSDIATADYSFL